MIVAVLPACVAQPLPAGGVAPPATTGVAAAAVRAALILAVAIMLHTFCWLARWHHVCDRCKRRRRRRSSGRKLSSRGYSRCASRISYFSLPWHPSGCCV